MVFFLLVYGHVCVFLQVERQEPEREGKTWRDGELSGRERERERKEREWESWDETLTWSFLVLQKQPVSSEALLRLQRNAFLVFLLRRN